MIIAVGLKLMIFARALGTNRAQAMHTHLTFDQRPEARKRGANGFSPEKASGKPA
jgi:hypothetical protein